MWSERESPLVNESSGGFGRGRRGEGERGRREEGETRGKLKSPRPRIPVSQFLCPRVPVSPRPNSDIPRSQRRRSTLSPIMLYARRAARETAETIPNRSISCALAQPTPQKATSVIRWYISSRCVGERRFESSTPARCTRRERRGMGDAERGGRGERGRRGDAETRRRGDAGRGGHGEGV